MSKAQYHRVLIKISGEALADEGGTGLDFDVLSELAEELRLCHETGTQIAIVVGAGNFWRGVKNGSGRLDRARSDHMGMLGTVMNALGLQDVLEQHGLRTAVMTAVEMSAFAEPFSVEKAVSHLENGRIVIFGCGTGNPFCSTDTAAVLRALEIGADIALLAKNIDGVYDRDPRKFPDAVRFDTVSYDTILEKHLGVIDSTAASMANDQGLNCLLFALKEPGNLYRALTGEKTGTVVQR